MIVLPFSSWAAVAAGCAVLLARPDPQWVAAHRLPDPARPQWPPRLLLAVAVPGIGCLLPLLDGAAAVVVLATGLGVAAFARRELRRNRRREEVRVAVREVTELVDALAECFRTELSPRSP